MQNKQLKKMEIRKNNLLIRDELPLSNFPKTLVDYLSQGEPLYFMETHFSLEEQGEEWRTRGLGDDDVKEFIYEVCRWGRGARLIPKIRDGKEGKRNTPARVRGVFRHAIALVDDEKLDQAVQHIQDEIHGLALSYASKQLRMIFPAKCVAYDSVLQEYLPYGNSADGYQDFCSDCVQMAAILNKRNDCAYPHKKLKGMCREHNLDISVPKKWRAADFEAAIFYHYYQK